MTGKPLSLKVMNLDKEYADCLTYIDSYWNKIIQKPTRKKINHHIITIPYKFITPNDKKFNYIFYWDTFFLFKGLLGTKRDGVMKNMVNNFTYLYNEYGIIPNFNSFTSTSRSQPPFLTSMILDVYNNALYKQNSLNFVNKSIYKFTKNSFFMNWLKKVTKIAKEEYNNVWLDPQDFFHHKVPGHYLSRYGDTDLGYSLSSELESGWDFTSRFYARCNDFLPVDLNCFLYKYEKDFATFADILNEPEEKKIWEKKSNNRKREINKLMWNEKEGFFYDYGHYYKRQSDFLSLAGYIPMWVGLATQNQAKKMVKKLKFFETNFGLVITAKKSLAPIIDLNRIPKRYHPALKFIIEPKQWDYPNIWPPLEYLTVIGLLKYGFIKDAKRIMIKSINAHAKIFRKYQTFFEKINGITADKPDEFQYSTQTGFRWTNAIFYRYIQILKDIETKKNIYFENQKKPPFELSILH